MLNFNEQILERVKANPRRLILPEGSDIRVLKAAELVMKEGFASELHVLGDVDKMSAAAKTEGIDLSGVILSDPKKSADLIDFTSRFFESRKHKGISEAEAREAMEDDVYHGAMMLKSGKVDAMVSGSMTPTAKTVRAGLVIVKPRKDIKTVSGSFAMLTDTEFGHEGAFIYADCGVVPEPTSEQLADIAIGSADMCRKLFATDPIVGFLSFSTMGSAKSPSVEKVSKAVEILKSRKVDFAFDGEMQFDAAVCKEIAAKKAPGSSVAGNVNVCIFPDLSAGNIAYKVTQRLAGADAYGPLLQGLSMPLNDLSRGASPEDIMMVSAITCAQAI